MDAVWLTPTSNPVLNTFLRSLIVIAVSLLAFKTTWYTAYWAAVIHDAISLVLIRPWL